MMKKNIRFIFLLPALSLISMNLVAKDSQVEYLEHKLKERDKVILELLERVEALEHRVGIAKTSPGAANKTKQDAAATLETTSQQQTSDLPGAVVASEDDAERALERSLTQDGAVLLPPGVLEIQPGLTYSRNEDATPALVSFGGNIYTGELERHADNVTADLAFRLGLPWESQLEIGVPFRWRNVESVTNIGFTPTSSSDLSGSGFGDLRIGLAKTLLHESLWQPDLVGRITWDTDTGKTSDNNISLGGGYNELEASVSLIKRQDPLVFFGGLSYQHSFENNQIQPGPRYLANLGSYIALSPETSLSFIFSAGYQDETKVAGSRIQGSDSILGTFTIGGSTLLGKGTLLNLNTGIGLTDDSDDFSIFLSLPVRLDKRIF